MTSSFDRHLLERLQDDEYRSEYGAEGVKYEFALALAHARRQSGLSQTELAAKAGVSQSYISKLESGNANPSIGALGGYLALMWAKFVVDIAPLVEPIPSLGRTIEARHMDRGPLDFEDRMTDQAYYGETAHSDLMTSLRTGFQSSVAGGI